MLLCLDLSVRFILPFHQLSIRLTMAQRRQTQQHEVEEEEEDFHRLIRTRDAHRVAGGQQIAVRERERGGVYKRLLLLGGEWGST